MSAPNPLRAYASVTAAYWAFMLSDGTLRMLVLLHFNHLGFKPVQLAWLFLLYEVAGIVINLAAGWLAARFGLAATLYGGLGLQFGALIALAQLDPAWPIAASVAFATSVQGVSGLAKGAGFVLGAALLVLAGFQVAVWGMALVLAVILATVVLFLPAGLTGRMEADEAWGGWRAKDPRVNRVSLARLFLFGARDVWFVVGIPVYFEAVLSDGTGEGRRAAFFLVGDIMALWIIAYGVVQAFAPSLLGAKGQSELATTCRAVPWAGALVPIPFALALVAYVAGEPAPWLTLTVILGPLALSLR